MNSRDWTELLTTVLLSLLTAYLKRHGEDAAQDVISKVSNTLVSDPVHKPFKLSELSELVSFHGKDVLLPFLPEILTTGTAKYQSFDSMKKEKELFRLNQGGSK